MSEKNERLTSDQLADEREQLANIRPFIHEMGTDAWHSEVSARALEYANRGRNLFGHIAAIEAELAAVKTAFTVGEDQADRALAAGEQAADGLRQATTDLKVEHRATVALLERITAHVKEPVRASSFDAEPSDYADGMQRARADVLAIIEGKRRPYEAMDSEETP